MIGSAKGQRLGVVIAGDPDPMPLVHEVVECCAVFCCDILGCGPIIKTVSQADHRFWAEFINVVCKTCKRVLGLIGGQGAAAAQDISHKSPAFAALCLEAVWPHLSQDRLAA